MAHVDQFDQAAPGSPIVELERQVERGSMFTQAVFQKSFTRLSLVEAMLGEVIDTLLAKGVIADDELPGVTAATADAEVRAAEHMTESQHSLRWPNVAVRVDPTEPDPYEPVDCAARMHVCKAVCCKLKFALTSEEIEVGLVKWDIGHPYIIRQSSTGYCCHNDSETKGCGIYDDRPSLCRRFSCKGDDRIWTDFDNMIINQEWIDQHVGRSDAILLVDASPSDDADVRDTDVRGTAEGSFPEPAPSFT
jgi:Fe-S-cluster containining protein